MITKLVCFYFSVDKLSRDNNFTIPIITKTYQIKQITWPLISGATWFLAVRVNTANSLGRYGYDYTTITGNVHSANMKMSRQNTIHCLENIDIPASIGL